MTEPSPARDDEGATTDTPADTTDTTLAAGVPGPSGTGEQTTAGADPDAPTTPSTTERPA